MHRLTKAILVRSKKAIYSIKWDNLNKKLHSLTQGVQFKLEVQFSNLLMRCRWFLRNIQLSSKTARNMNLGGAIGYTDIMLLFVS